MTTNPKKTTKAPEHPLDDLIRTDRIPHIWCSGRGIGTVFLLPERDQGHRPALQPVHHGLGHRLLIARRGLHCSTASTPPTAGPSPLPAASRWPGRAEGDRLLRGRRPVRHRRQPLHSRGPAQHGPDRDLREQPDLRHDRRPGGGHHPLPGQVDHHVAHGQPGRPFNLPLLAYAAGACTARWTILQTRDLTTAINEAILRKGFSFIEVAVALPGQLRPPQQGKAHRHARLPGPDHRQERRGPGPGGYRLQPRRGHRQVRRSTAPPATTGTRTIVGRAGRSERRGF